MKSCLYKIFLFWGIALLLASCVDDPLSPHPSGDGGGSGDVEGFSLRIGIPTPDMGTLGENMINGVRIVLYATGGSVMHSWDLDIQVEYDSEEQGLKASGEDLKELILDNTGYFIQTTARKVEDDRYYMLIIVNPNDAIKAITKEGDSQSDLDPSILSSTSNLHGSWVGDGSIAGGPAYFLMFNSQGLVPLSNRNFQISKELAELNPVYVSVERVAAKVTCNFTGFTASNNASNTRSTSVAPYGRFVMLLDYNNQEAAPWGKDYDIPEDCTKCPVCGADFNLETKACTAHPHHTYDGLGLVADRVRYMVATDFMWQIDIVNKKSYWLRHLTHKAGGSKKEIQGDTDRENFYAEDPNFTGTTNLSEEFTYVPATDNFTNTAKLFPAMVDDYQYTNYWSWTAADAAADATPLYIPENTMAKDDQTHDVVTRVLFKAVLKREQFTATGTKTTFGSDESAAPISDFFVFKGGNTDNEDYKYNNYNKDGSTFYILRPEDVAIYATAANTNNIHIYLRTGILDAIDDFKSKNPNFDWSDIGSNDPAMGDNLIFYKNGEMYYEVPIEHFATMTNNVPDYGCFGVVRNNWYKLNVENIISLGQPTIPAATNTLITKTSGGGSSGGGSSTRSTEGNGGVFRYQSIIF
ncbi:fimbria major subunit [Bacteroides sp. OttesenSCG-928-J23]|nr:fimbria major subunit [Bacteroides sp. OttesenSCG-928-J23]